MRTLPTLILIAMLGGIAGYCEETVLISSLPDNENYQAFRGALRNGDVGKVKALVAARPELVTNGMWINGITPLNEAGCNLELIKFLLAHGAESQLDIPDNGGHTPFQNAAASCGKEVIELFLAHKAKVNARDFNRSTPLHAAAYSAPLETVVFLLDHHAEIEALDSRGATPLYDAASARRVDVVKLLIARGANVNLTAGRWPLLFTGVYSNDLMKALLEGKADPNLPETVNGQTCLHDASTFGRSNQIALLLQYKADVNIKDKAGRTPLIAAAEGYYSTKETIDLLLAHHAKVNLEDNSGKTALYWAAVNGHLDFLEPLQQHGAKNPDANGLQRAIHIGELLKASMDGETQTVKGLLAGDPSIAKEARQDGWTPLHASRGYSEITDRLLACGANVNARDAEGRTPLWLAASNNLLTVMEVLLAHRADVTIKDNSGQTPLQVAEQAKHIEAATLLRQHGAK